MELRSLRTHPIAACLRDLAVVAAIVLIATLAAYGVQAGMSPSVPLAVTVAVFEEFARSVAVLFLTRERSPSTRSVAIRLGGAFGLLEITNAFFPDRYASVEAQTSPFLLLAAFEFGFGFLLHAGLTFLMVWVGRRIGWPAALAVTIAIHGGWNLLLVA